ncbi:MAG: hypothetical protein IPQ03_11665 [Bacteroidetes bacterium]|nr:hypothetical protein [Bacteroidota bacterium]
MSTDSFCEVVSGGSADKSGKVVYLNEEETNEILSLEFNSEASQRLLKYGDEIVTALLDWDLVDKILSIKPKILKLQVPIPDGSFISVELVQHNLFDGILETGQFSSEGKSKIDYTPGLYYRGKIKGVENLSFHLAFLIII